MTARNGNQLLAAIGLTYIALGEPVDAWVLDQNDGILIGDSLASTGFRTLPLKSNGSGSSRSCRIRASTQREMVRLPKEIEAAG